MRLDILKVMYLRACIVDAVSFFYFIAGSTPYSSSLWLSGNLG